jgi:hypothetical protein
VFCPVRVILDLDRSEGRRLGLARRASMLQLCHAFRVLGASPGSELAMLATLSNVHV